EEKKACRRGIVKRFDAEPVACAKQPARPSVPNRECEHPLNPLQAVLAPAEICLQQHFGVGARGELPAGALQLGAQLAMIVDLAVEDDRGAFGGHRLDAAVGEVENSKTAVAERDANVGISVAPILRQIP